MKRPLSIPPLVSPSLLLPLPIFLFRKKGRKCDMEVVKSAATWESRWGGEEEKKVVSNGSCAPFCLNLTAAVAAAAAAAATAANKEERKTCTSLLSFHSFSWMRSPSFSLPPVLEISGKVEQSHGGGTEEKETSPIDFVAPATPSGCASWRR